MPNTPTILWPGVWLLVAGAAWVGIYELAAVWFKIGPTISSLVIPNIMKYPFISIPLLVVFVGFLVWLFAFDWYKSFL